MSAIGKHALGPWTEEREIYLGKLGEDPNRCCVEIQSRGLTIGYWYGCEWDGYSPESRLIAAAPDLLDALEGLLPMWQSGIDEPWVRKAREAIARATGVAGE